MYVYLIVCYGTVLCSPGCTVEHDHTVRRELMQFDPKIGSNKTSTKTQSIVNSAISSHPKIDHTMLRSFVPLLLVLLNYNSHCFTSVITAPRQHNHPTTTSLYSQNTEIFVISLEGVAIDMTDWRIQQGIRAALDSWPHLLDFMGEEQKWLRNKMSALSHVMTRRPGYSPTCDFAMLTRLLLEEQSLDGGRSTGKMGKYASRFHPSSCDNRGASTSGGTAGSRPLTVGEIEVNWCDGACLSETLMTRYNIHGQNPLIILQKCINKQPKKVKRSLYTLYETDIPSHAHKHTHTLSLQSFLYNP